jgi:hypothetical protein
MIIFDVTNLNYSESGFTYFSGTFRQSIQLRYHMNENWNYTDIEKMASIVKKINVHY